MKKIPMQKGYPTSDGKIHKVHAEAVMHQTDIDLIDACQEFKISDGELKAFLEKNTEVVSDYIKKHLTQKPAPKKPADTKPAVEQKKGSGAKSEQKAA